MKRFLLIVLIVAAFRTPASGWHDETHLAIAKAAGYAKWYNAAGADITKIKANRVEMNNHYFNNNGNVKVTPGMVLSQIKAYNDPSDTEGHLYGAIIASLRAYKKASEAGKYAEYHVAFCVHYAGDLSQPLHSANDGVVEDEALKNVSRIEKSMYPIRLRKDHVEEDLAQEIARIADLSRILGHKLRNENRDMTRDEAYVQLGHSASLLRAVLQASAGYNALSAAGDLVVSQARLV